MPHTLQKLLILQGSPHHDGRVANCANVIAGISKDAFGAQVRVINTHGLHLHPCSGCMDCRISGRCILPSDDARMVVEAIRWCDALIVAAPTYWANMPGTLKLLFDRIVPALINTTPGKHFPQPLHSGKRYAIITACSTPWPFNRILGESGAMVATVKRIFRYSGFKYVDSIQMGGQQTVNNKECMRIVKKLLINA